MDATVISDNATGGFNTLGSMGDIMEGKVSYVPRSSAAGTVVHPVAAGMSGQVTHREKVGSSHAVHHIAAKMGGNPCCS
jgi:hypothetical protein